MSTYREQLARQEARRQPTVYLERKEYSQLKANLTRAKKKGGKAVLEAVEKALARFNETVWPDDWPLWRNALEDEASRLQMAARDEHDFEKQDAMFDLADELRAAAILLFP